MTQTLAIPPASLERLRRSYAQFERLCSVVAEAMSIPPEAARHLDLARGVFELPEPAEHTNGVGV